MLPVGRPAAARRPRPRCVKSASGGYEQDMSQPSSPTGGPGTDREGGPPLADPASGAPAETTAAAAPSPPTGAPLEIRRTRASTAYVSVAVGLAVLIVVLIFVLQNLSDASIHFLGAHFRMPVGLLVLAAAIAGGVVVLLVSLARVLQLRLLARRHRHSHESR
jgi:uncharacterized integral membrane protein